MIDYSNLPPKILPEHLLADDESPVCEARLDSDGTMHQCRLSTHADPKTHVAIFNNFPHVWQTL